MRIFVPSTPLLMQLQHKPHFLTVHNNLTIRLAPLGEINLCRWMSLLQRNGGCHGPQATIAMLKFVPCGPISGYIEDSALTYGAHRHVKASHNSQTVLGNNIRFANGHVESLNGNQWHLLTWKWSVVHSFIDSLFLCILTYIIIKWTKAQHFHVLPYCDGGWDCHSQLGNICFTTPKIISIFSIR